MCRCTCYQAVKDEWKLCLSPLYLLVSRSLGIGEKRALEESLGRVTLF